MFPPLCDLCQQAVSWGALSNDERKSSSLNFARPSRLGPELTIGHCAELKLLFASSENCSMCKFLWLSIPDRQHEQYARYSVKLIQTRLRSRSALTALIMELWEPVEVDEPGFNRIGESLISICNDSNPIAERSIWITHDPLFSARVPVVKSWLHTCFTEHSNCQLARTSYPARFLDLGEADCPEVRLVNSDQVQQTIHFIQYVALSHCWSASATNPYCTTKANLETNLDSIPLSQLSKTFLDAIRVTRALGLRFLWIDSLCIVQDDRDDWAAEAAKMAQVYHGSHVTIAATSSMNREGSWEGGLHLDTLAPSIPVKLKDTDGEHSNTSMCFVRFPAASRRRIWDSTLSSRAWILQEQVLSPRLVHFTENQMFFQCHAGLESEDSTLKDVGLTSLKTNSLTTEESLGLRDFSTPISAISSWWSWVVEYSGRSLTFPSDRMAAIAGIVDYYFRSVVLDEAMLGLWRNSLWSDLGWQVDDKSNQEIISHSPDKIPSWSWLSIPPGKTISPVKNLANITKDGYTKTLRLVEWDVKWEGPAFTSSLISSRLIVSGLFKPLVGGLPPSRGKNKRRVDFESSWDAFLDVTISLDKIPDVELEADLFLLCLFQDEIYEYFILTRAEKGKDTVGYKRLGSGSIHRPRGRAGFFHDVVETQIMLI